MAEGKRKKILKVKLEQNPGDIKALIELGFLHILEDANHDESLRLLNRVLELDPKNVEAMFWLANSYYHCFYDEKKAKEILEKALKINPHDAACHKFLADIFRGLDKSYNKSIYHIKKTIESEPTWITPRIRLSRYLMKIHKFDEAEIVAKEAIEIFKKTKFPITETRMEEYYEECIRGRLPSEKKYIEELFEDIKKARKEYGKQSK